MEELIAEPVAAEVEAQLPPLPQLPPCTVLCVDDEANVLSALTRLLRPRGLNLLTASSGDEALALMARAPVHVLLTDMRMPGMDGAQLLAAARERWPDTVRLLLTGHADHDATVRAINGGQVWAYLHKPWDTSELLSTVTRACEMALLSIERARLQALAQSQYQELQALNAGLAQHVEERTAALTQAHARLKRNYMTSIKVFANVMELRNGALVGHGRRVAELACPVARALGCDDEQVQHLFVASLLHDVGLIGLPDTAMSIVPQNMDSKDEAYFRRHTVLGEQSLLALEDLRPAAALIRSHHERWDGRGFPDCRIGTDIELGARILAACDYYDEQASGAFGQPAKPIAQVHAALQRNRGRMFDPDVVDVLLQLPRQTAAASAVPSCAVPWPRLRAGMVLATDLLSADGAMLLSADHVLTEDMIRRISDHARRASATLTLQVRLDSLVNAGGGPAAASP